MPVVSVLQYSFNGDGDFFQQQRLSEHATEDRARAESPSTEVCAYIGLICGFLELVRHVKRRLEKSILFPATWIPFPLTSATLPR